MANIQYLQLLEAVDRRSRLTSTGMEIVTTFYVEPATAAPIVVCALLGQVTGTSLANYGRNLPAQDYQYPFCYCVEAHETPFDKRSVASSPARLPLKFGNFNVTTLSAVQAALANPISFDGPVIKGKPATAGTTGIEQAGLAQNMCGAYIEAVYRPLSSIYSGNTPANAFDYIDPQFYPCSRTVPIKTLAIRGVIPLSDYYVADSGLLTDTWSEFTIRRVMCPSVPWSTIQQLTNRINGQKAWSPANMSIVGLPNNTFPLGTLRFDSAEPIKRIIPTCLAADGTTILTTMPTGSPGAIPTTRQMQWYDIIYKFSWRTTFAVWGNKSLQSQGPMPLPWFVEWYDGSTWANIIPGWYEATFPFILSSQIFPADIVQHHKYLDAEDPTLPLNQAPPRSMALAIPLTPFS